MPPLESLGRTQKAVLMSASGADAYGEPLRGTPVEIMVRWNTKRTQMLTSKGEVVALDATAVVGQRIEIGSQMWLGALVDWYGTGSGQTDDELMEVKTYSETPDLKGRNSLKTVGLMRFRNTPAARA